MTLKNDNELDAHPNEKDADELKFSLVVAIIPLPIYGVGIGVSAAVPVLSLKYCFNTLSGVGPEVLSILGVSYFLLTSAMWVKALSHHDNTVKKIDDLMPKSWKP